MRDMTVELTELAAINLHFAQAEIATMADRSAFARALDHIRQAGHCLEIAAAELDVSPDEAEAA